MKPKIQGKRKRTEQISKQIFITFLAYLEFYFTCQALIQVMLPSEE